MKKIFNVHPLFKEDIQKAKDLLAKKGYVLDINKFDQLNAGRLLSLVSIESLKQKINTLSKTNKKDPEFDANVLHSKALKESLKTLEQKYLQAEIDFSDFYCTIPNFPHESVPNGLIEDDNVVIKEHLAPTEFTFQPVDHTEIGIKDNQMDFKAGVALAGSRFVVLRNDISLLHRALTQFMMDTHTNDHYEEHYVPYIVNEQALYGTGQLPKFQEDLYQLKNKENAYLIPTAEVPLTNLYAHTTVSEIDLPINMVGHTPCFRSEAGSYSKDIVGLIRQHQFEKVELVKISRDDNSYEELELLLLQAEKILQYLNIPYRVVALCGGDLGFSASKTYDIEVWIPSQNKYREIASVSNCEDFQARRMLAKYKGNDKSKYIHTLNGSGVAVGRCMIALLENYQQADGSVIIPDVLVPYMKGKKVILK